jgi:hypothetical protein
MTEFMRGMSGHQRSSGKTDEWLTPPEIITALGPFDLDPCATHDQAHHNVPWSTGQIMYSGRPANGTTCQVACNFCVDGLKADWRNWSVWMNPPYGRQIGFWFARLAKHGNGMALAFARTETGWFQDCVFRTATSLFFLSKRLRFYKPDGTKGGFTGGAPSVLIAYGKKMSDRLRTLQMRGHFLELR